MRKTNKHWKFKKNRNKNNKFNKMNKEGIVRKVDDQKKLRNKQNSLKFNKQLNNKKKNNNHSIR